VLSPDTVFPWLKEADFERVVFAPGKRIEVSVKSRLFKGATKRAIELRDRQCTHEYCDLTVDQCQIDHIIPWDRGGPTEQENGRLLCGFHNRLRNGREPPDGEPD
jgi:5-methylcytosine-specific restriction endonuclease McrA